MGGGHSVFILRGRRTRGQLVETKIFERKSNRVTQQIGAKSRGKGVAKGSEYCQIVKARKNRGELVMVSTQSGFVLRQGRKSLKSLCIRANGGENEKKSQVWIK